MTVNDWLKKPVKTHTYSDGSREIQENRPRLYCNDGVGAKFVKNEN